MSASPAELAHRNGSRSDWPREMLGRLVSIKYGKLLATKDFSPKGYPVFGANGVIGHHTNYNYEREQVLISCRGAYSGRINLSPPQCYVTNNSLVLEIPKESPLQTRFLFYALQAVDRSKLVTGSAQPQVTINNAEVIQVPVPSKDEQRRIVAEIEKQFTRLDAGVAALRRVQANLKRYRAAVLKAACEGRLVPTEAELARKEGRSYETGEQLLQRILKARCTRWAEANRNRNYHEPSPPAGADLRPVPEGWACATVEQLSILVQYGSSAKTNEGASGVPVVRMGNIEDGKLVLNSLKYLPKSHDEFPDLLLRKGDLLFNRTNSAELVGKTAVFRGIPEPCSFASYLIRVRFCEGYLPEMAAYFINSAFGRAWIADVVSQQVGQANVNGTKLQALAIPLPPLSEQTRIVAEVERRLSVVEELEAVVSANLQRAARLRQSILQKAFSGQL